MLKNKPAPLPEWMINPPETLEERLALLKVHSRYLTRKNSKRGRFLRTLLKDVKHELAQVNEQAKIQDPLSFFKPSYDQAIILNAWMLGITFLCIYTANRIGKTTAVIINNVLFIFPNEPRWHKKGIFKPYLVGSLKDDPINIHNPRRGKLVQVFPRPNIECVYEIHAYIKKHKIKTDPMKQFYESPNKEALQQLQRALPHCYSPAYPYAPFNKGGQIWMGAPDHGHHKTVIMPLWKEYIPASSMERYVPTDQEMTFTVRGPKRTTVWSWLGKSYDSKDTKWSSGAVDIIHLTEGITPSLLKEAKARFKHPAAGGHDFTPYEPSNTGAATSLARKIWKGTETLPVPYAVFEGFSVIDAPLHIIPKEKKEELIKTYANDPEGQARIYGKFWSSSMLVLDNLEKTYHLLPWSIEELFARFPNCPLYRGLDPGKDHPTACAWGLLTPQNQWIIYRIYSQRGLSIQERCHNIVTLSNNVLVPVYYGKRGPEDFYLVETHPNKNSEIINLTYADYHIFKEDENTKLSYSLNYVTAGLQVNESTHMGPEDRALKLNSQLKPNRFKPGLQLLQSPTQPIMQALPPGAEVYFLEQGPGIIPTLEIWDDFYWQRYKGGELKGEPKDQIPDHNDDELDAVCYITCNNLRWTSHRPRARIIDTQDLDADRSLSQAATLIRQRQKQTAQISLQQLQSHTNREVRIFGGDSVPSSPQCDEDNEDNTRWS